VTCNVITLEPLYNRREAVFYQIYPASSRETPPIGVPPDSYAYQGIGNFEGIISSLDYLQHDLGVDAIWVSPHYESPERDMVRTKLPLLNLAVIPLHGG
jgi:hypothetical protein